MQPYHYLETVLIQIRPSFYEKRYIDDTLNACVFLRNLMIQEISDAWRFNRIFTPGNALEFSRLVTQIKARPEHSGLNNISSNALRNSAFELMGEFRRFLKSNGNHSYPKMLDPKKNVSFRLNSDAFKIDNFSEDVIPQNASRYGISRSGIKIPDLGCYKQYLNGVEFMRDDGEIYSVKLLRGYPIEEV
jgi:transposase